MTALLKHTLTALLKHTLTALLEYIDHLYKFFKGAHVPPAHPSLNDESNATNYCAVLLLLAAHCNQTK